VLKVQEFLKLTLDGGEWSVNFTPWPLCGLERVDGSFWIEDWVHLRACKSLKHAGNRTCRRSEQFSLSTVLYVPGVRGQTKSEIHRNGNLPSQHCQDNKLQYKSRGSG
jgi:hypothetical protein